MLGGEQAEADPEDVDTVLKTDMEKETVPDNLSPRSNGDSFPQGEKSPSDAGFAVDGNVLDSDLVPDIDDRDVLSLIGASAVECGSFEESFMNKLEERLNELENQDEEAVQNEDVAAETEGTSEVVAVEREDSKKETTEPVTPGSSFMGSILMRALQQPIKKTPPQENKLPPRANLQDKIKGKVNKNRDQAFKSSNSRQKSTKEFGILKKGEDAETPEERQIRTGEMTPFGTVIERSEKSASGAFVGFQRYLNSQKALSDNAKKTQKTKSMPEKSASAYTRTEFPSKTKRLHVRKDPLKVDVLFPKKKRRTEVLGTTSSRSVDNVRPGKVASEAATISLYEEDSDFQPPTDGSDYDEWGPEATKEKTRTTRKRKLPGKRKTYKELDTDESFSEEEEVRKSSKRMKKEADDGDPEFFKKRVEEWKANEVRFSGEFHSLPGGFRLPNHIWDSLYDYQKVGVSWFWELHQKNCGGILGDEMGLGKTIQVITFLAGLSCSNMLWRFNNFRGLGPTLIVCPATVMHQWVKEFHTWWPPFRCVILHESGSYTGSKSSIIRSVGEKGGILITSYVGLVNSQPELLKYSWHYVILDEGHKIRNPDAQITLAVKQIPTPHRIILSGSPLQNNLKELWSLFDFVFPGKLGTLPTFMEQFAVPITQGGYANASDIQVAAAFKCATVLRDIISPYLLRRMKSDVKHHVNLPPKSEQVLFCKLTDEQKACYINYLQSKEIDSIVQGRYNLFVGLINLRKICNHPHLFSGGPKTFASFKKLNDRIPQVKAARGKTGAADAYNSYKSLKAEVSDKEEGETSDSDLEFGADESFGDWKKSGKMIVLETLLKLWKKQNHKVLLFSQSRQMLCILENFVRQQGYTYLRLDGSTTIGARQPLIQKFNEDPSIFVFILTTKVGGLGVNLTGANRVIIFDPDWNPSTDLQARERAWRIGQDRQVTIYRLITSGTIEEKIYHRQIFKQFLTNRVLKNPKQKRFFKASDVIELFSFNEGVEKGNESQAIFAGTGSSVKVESRKRKRRHSSKSDDVPVPVSESDGFAESTNHEAIEPREKSSGKFKGVPHLVKQKSQKHDPAAEKTEDTDEKQDDYVLKKLFRKSGVHAALKHDKILETNESDYLLVDKEAERVAADAVKLLKKSREQCWAAETGRVTFTGSSGTLRTEPARKKLRLGGSKPMTITKSPKLPEEPSEQSFFSGPKKLDDDSETLSSAELVAAIRARKRPVLPDPADENPNNSNEPTSGETPGPSNNRSSNENLDHVKAEHIEMLREIREFIAFRAQVDGQASTTELVAEFGNKLPSQDSPLFKQMLNQLCTFRRVDGQGIWKLKPEFR